MDILTLITHLAGGVIGGNIAGGLLKKISLGKVGNSVIGIIGGLLGGHFLSNLNIDAENGGTDFASILSMLGDGAIGGGVLMIVAGLVKWLIKK